MGGTGRPLGKTFLLQCQRRHPQLPKIPTYLPRCMCKLSLPTKPLVVVISAVHAFVCGAEEWACLHFVCRLICTAIHVRARLVWLSSIPPCGSLWHYFAFAGCRSLTCTFMAPSSMVAWQQACIYGTAWHSTAQHSTAQHSTAEQSTAQHSTAPLLYFAMCIQICSLLSSGLVSRALHFALSVNCSFVFICFAVHLPACEQSVFSFVYLLLF